MGTFNFVKWVEELSWGRQYVALQSHMSKCRKDPAIYNMDICMFMDIWGILPTAKLMVGRKSTQFEVLF